MSPRARGGPRTHRRAADRRGVGTVLLGCLALAGCAASDSDDGDGSDDSPAASGSGVTVDSRMVEQPVTWETGLLDDGARLEFLDGAYRMTATGWPLLSPSMDRRTVALDPVVVEARVTRVTGTGLYGVACGITDTTAYVFLVGAQGGAPYYGVAVLRDGVAEVLADPSLEPDAPRAATVVGDADSTKSVRATCSSGPEPGTAVLEMTVDRRQVLEVDSDAGEPTGQAGLVALSRSAGELVVDVEGVVISSPG